MDRFKLSDYERLDSAPDRMDRAKAIARALAGPDQASVEVNRTLDGFDHLPQGDGLRCVEQRDAATRSPLGADKASVREGLDNLAEVRLGDARAMAEILGSHRSTRRLSGKIHDNADRIVSFQCQLHE